MQTATEPINKGFVAGLSLLNCQRWDYSKWALCCQCKEKRERERELINEAEKQIAVQTCEEDDDKSVQFYKEKSNGVLSVRWNAKDLINTIARLCDWDLRQTSYRVNGVLVPELNLMLFDLNEAVTMV